MYVYFSLLQTNTYCNDVSADSYTSAITRAILWCICYKNYRILRTCVLGGHVYWAYVGFVSLMLTGPIASADGGLTSIAAATPVATSPAHKGNEREQRSSSSWTFSTCTESELHSTTKKSFAHRLMYWWAHLRTDLAYRHLQAAPVTHCSLCNELHVA